MLSVIQLRKMMLNAFGLIVIHLSVVMECLWADSHSAKKAHSRINRKQTLKNCKKCSFLELSLLLLSLSLKLSGTSVSGYHYLICLIS
jgi:hypothetical protein